MEIEALQEKIFISIGHRFGMEVCTGGGGGEDDEGEVVDEDVAEMVRKL